MIDYYNPYPGLLIPPSNQALADIYQPQLNAIIRQTAAQYGVAVGNVATGFDGREAQLLYVNQGIYSNPLLLIPFTPWFQGAIDFHPRPAGHAVIADALWSALGMVPLVPTFAELPDLFAPTVALVAPWACGECETSIEEREQFLLPALDEPRSHTIEWLGTQLWNRITRPLLCWLFAMYQSGLNVYAATLNTYWLPAINDLYRLIYGMFFWLTSGLTAFFHLGEDMRAILWAMNGNLARLAGNQSGGTLSTVATSGELAALVSSAMMGLLTSAWGAWAYMLTIWIGTVPQLWATLTDLANNRPTQLAALADFWLFGALVGTIRALADSQLGWWLLAQFGLFYTATVLYLIDTTGDL